MPADGAKSMSSYVLGKMKTKWKSDQNKNKHTNEYWAPRQRHGKAFI